MFDPVRICTILNEEAVDYVVVEGFAAVYTARPCRHATSTSCRHGGRGGLGGFEEWDASAIVVEIADGLPVHVASLDDVIASKRAANRPKDQRSLPYLESLREQLG